MRVRAGILVVAGCGAALVLSGCGSTDSSAPATSTPLPSAAALQTTVNELVAVGVPGVIVVAQRGANSYNVSAGVSDIASQQTIDSTSVARIASVSKPFSAAIILQLAATGKLTLTDPISKLLPTVPKQWGAATISQVLQHTSGIPDYIKDKKFLKQFIANPQMQRTPQQLVDYVANEPLAFLPGSQYMYSDTDNIVAGLIAENLLGKPYSEILTADVATPLGLDATTLPETSELPSGYIHGYGAADPKAPDTTAPEDVSMLINPGLAWASGGMVSTGGQLNTFVRDLLAGKIVNADVLTNPNGFVPGAGGPPGPGENSSGIGIYRYQTSCGTVFGHTGNMPGYTAFIASDSTGTNSVSVLINTQVTPKSSPDLFNKLLAVENQAICSVLDQQPQQ